MKIISAEPSELDPPNSCNCPLQSKEGFFLFHKLDCSSGFHRFENYQDLPTIGTIDVEQFSIDGSLFLAFASHRTNTGFNTKSFIYKMDDSTGRFSLYQTIVTNAAYHFEYFSINNKHYLAVANFKNGVSYKLDSVVYQWNGQKFVPFQNIKTKGGTSFNFFKTSTGEEKMFLVVTNYRSDTTNSVSSVIYRWKNNQFEIFQELETEGALESTMFVINNEIFIAFANFYNSAQSTLFKLSGERFAKLQSFQTNRTRDVSSFNIDGETFLVFANDNNIDSFIYKWNGSRFVLFQSIPAGRATACSPFVMCGQTYLGMANYVFGGDSVVYKFSGTQFIKYQEFPSPGAFDIESFVYKSHAYLVITNYRNNHKNFNINSMVYKWT